MPKRRATASRKSRSSVPCDAPPGAVEKWTRRKNSPEMRSPNWALSMMFASRSARNPETANTIPTVSGQEMVSMYSDGALM